MAKHTISADIRDTNEKVSHIRQSKRVPGVVYGRHQEPISIVMDSSDFLRLYRKAGESNIINIFIKFLCKIWMNKMYIRSILFIINTSSNRRK